MATSDETRPLQSRSDQLESVGPDDFIDSEYEKELIEARKKGFIAFPGVGNEKRPEIKTNYNQTSAEKVIDGPTNCFLVLGNDRNAGEDSGLGGLGMTGCAAIDIIAGHLGPRPINKVGNTKVISNKNFESDASRIYLSQKSKIDEYFKIKKYPFTLGTVKLDMENSVAKAAIGIKSDCIRIVGRESIKLVTNHLGKNSLDRDIEKGGIDIIAGFDVADESLAPQPMVKGNNLIELLQKIISTIENTQATVTTFMETQNAINSQLISHVHQAAGHGLPTSTMIENQCIPLNFDLIFKTLPDIITNFIKIADINEYFNHSSRKYINSRYNRVN